MLIEVEVTEDGTLKVSPEQHKQGSKMILNAAKGIQEPAVGQGDWNSIKEAFEAFDTLETPRRSHEDILRDLHSYREL